MDQWKDVKKKRRQLYGIKVEASHILDSIDPYMAGRLVYIRSSQT
jgi:hypothetical protein